MDIEVRLKYDDFLMIVGNLDHDDEISMYDLYGYDEQENQIMFKLTKGQTIDLLDSLIRRDELKEDVKQFIKKYNLVD